MDPGVMGRDTCILNPYVRNLDTDIRCSTPGCFDYQLIDLAIHLVITKIKLQADQSCNMRIDLFHNSIIERIT